MKQASASTDRRTSARPATEATAHLDAIYTLARASELHDVDTGNHVLRIRAVAKAVALRLGFSEQDADALGYDAMLHDVGKLMVPPEILRKPKSLTEKERRMMESHTIRGESVLGHRPTMRRACRIARSHHEAWDGSGYPDALKGDEIPIEARITTAADILDALLSQRSYKKAWGYSQAMEEIERLRGTKLDPAVVDALKRCDADGVFRQIYHISEA